jgi:hypothetical protein
MLTYAMFAWANGWLETLAEKALCKVLVRSFQGQTGTNVGTQEYCLDVVGDSLDVPPVPAT